VPVVAGSFLIIGALVGFFTNWLVKGRELKHAEISRWDNDVLETCLALLETYTDIDATRDQQHPDYIEGPAEQVAAYHGIVRRQEVLVQRLEFIASSKLAAEARRLNDAVEKVHLDRVERYSAKQFMQFVADYQTVRKSFVNVVRKELRARE
jgi:hypothetical protein